MCNDNIKKLPFWETVSRSFKYVLKNKKLLIALLPVVGILTIIQAMLGWPVMCSYNQNYCLDGWQQTISSIVLVLTAVGIIISYCRSIICKENIELFSLRSLKRMGFYILWSIMLTVMVGIPMVLIIVAFSFTGIADNAILTVTLLSFVIVGIGYAPLIVGFPALAVDDYKILKLSKLYALAKGNKALIFLGQLAIMIPFVILSNTFVYMYLFVGLNNVFINLLFTIIALFLSVLDVSFRGAFFAHVYQFLKYYDKDKE